MHKEMNITNNLSLPSSYSDMDLIQQGRVIMIRDGKSSEHLFKNNSCFMFVIQMRVFFFRIEM